MARNKKNYSNSYSRKRKRKFRKKDVNTIIIALLATIFVFSVISGLTTVMRSETKAIHPVFEVGGIDEATGEHVTTEESIYTKNLFECKGLAVELDYDATVEYQVFYYDADEAFLSATEASADSVELDVPEDAVYARIVVTPDWETINGDDEKAENVIKWYDVSKYANMLQITVLRVQEDEKEEESEGKSVMAAYINDFDISEMTAFTPASAPFMYKDTVNSMLAGKELLQIGVPVLTIEDSSQDNTFTVYVVNGEIGGLTVVDTLELTIKANTYSTNTINEWVYFDVNYQLAEDEMLLFMASDGSDTIIPGFISNVTNSYISGFYKNSLSSSYDTLSATLVFDFIVAE